MTAHALVTSTYPVAHGEDVLVHAAAGGVGLLLTQLVTARGGRVIGTVSTEEKAALARDAGAAEVIRYDQIDDLAAEVRRLTDGQGVAVVYDGVGKTTFDASLASLRVRGMLVLFGGASGPVPPVDPQRLNAGGSLYLTRPTVMQLHTATRKELEYHSGEVFAAVADGTLDIRIGHRYPLADAARAHEDLQAGAPPESWCSSLNSRLRLLEPRDQPEVSWVLSEAALRGTQRRPSQKGQPSAGRPSAASTAMVMNSPHRYVFDRWNSRIGRAGWPARTVACSRWAMTTNQPPASTATTAYTTR